MIVSHPIPVCYSIKECPRKFISETYLAKKTQDLQTNVADYVILSSYFKFIVYSNPTQKVTHTS